MGLTTKLALMAALVLALAMATHHEPIMANAQTVTICNMTKEGLKACQPSVTAQNPVLPPPPDCCSALKSCDLQCFCAFKGSYVLKYYKIDFDQAMKLPAICGIPQNFHC